MADRGKYKGVGKGRPAKNPRLKEEDYDTLEELGKIHCTQKEAAAVLNVPEWIISSDSRASEAMNRGRGVGNRSLRRAQWRRAMQGNSTLLVFLGKNYLGQRDTFLEEEGEEVGRSNTEKAEEIASGLARALARGD